MFIKILINMIRNSYKIFLNLVTYIDCEQEVPGQWSVHRLWTGSAWSVIRTLWNQLNRCELTMMLMTTTTTMMMILITSETW